MPEPVRPQLLQARRRAFWRGARRGLLWTWMTFGVPTAIALFAFGATTAAIMALGGHVLAFLGWMGGYCD